MNNIRRLVFLGLVVGTLTGLTPQQIIYVSKVEKNTVNKYLNRFVTVANHIVVTQEPVLGAKESKKIVLSENEPLYFFESHGVTPASCVENICWSKTEVHQHGSFFLGALNNSEITSSLARLNIEMDFSTSLRQQDISQEFLKEKLEILAGEREFNGKLISERQSVEGKKIAREFLKKEFLALGFNVIEQAFEGRRGARGVNLIAEKAGSTSRFWVVSAHYDSMKTAGADDDATGIVTMLAVAAHLAERELKTGIKFVAFDLEEAGLLGSEAFMEDFVKNNRVTEVVGDIQLEMTGYDSNGDGHVHIIDCEENSSGQITKLIEKVITQESLKLKKVSACTNRSDHSVFWERGLPAIVMSENFFGGDGNPCYHRSCDKVNLINFNFMQMISMSILESVLVLVNQ